MPRDVEALALRGRPGCASRPVAMEIRIETAITQIDDHTIRYRGHDALALATTATFEQVAELLWTGSLPASPSSWPSDAIAADHRRRTHR